jgi:hypothetical protein
MLRVRVATDLGECRGIWESHMPDQLVTDLWEVRACFDRYFRRPPHFLVCENGGAVAGLLPLCWIEEASGYGYFPGETWRGTTWLEQNRIVADSEAVLAELLAHCPENSHIRYLLPPPAGWTNGTPVDEVGYLFHPPRYGFDLERYFQEFRRKTAKRINREVSELAALGLELRLDDPSDFDEMVRLNLSRFGERSYYHDDRFRESFRDLMNLLHDRGWLRMTTVILGGQVAAVDMGCVYRGTYTLVAGGTHAGFSGVAKLINLRHMEYACREGLDAVDFMCGDFGWKSMFHLAPRPLYVLSNNGAAQSVLQ